MTEDTGLDAHLDDPGVPAEDGESWGEAADRMQADVTIDVSCPRGCFDLEVTGNCEFGDSRTYLMNVAIADDTGPCPHCGAEVEPEVVEGV